MSDAGIVARLAGLSAPLDPRIAWDLPAFGAMPPMSELDEMVTRVLAPNPSPLTLDGTNTYVVVGDAGVAAVVDPGPPDAGHLARVEEALTARGAEVGAVVVTHHHPDHADAAAGWADRFSCRVHAAMATVAGPGGEVVAGGDRIRLPGLTLEVVATPGHSRDHLAFRLPTGALLTGDHVLGRGTSVVAHPDGDLPSYLDSLRRVLELGSDALLPGHGPELTEDPTAVVRFYLDHREFRSRQIRAVLESGPATPRQIVEVVYAEVARVLWPAAEASTRAGLDALIRAGEVARSGTRYRLV